MPRTLVVPLSMNDDGSFATTTDPNVIVRQRILDLLVTSKWERVHRPNHGCDLEGFLFTNVIEHLLSTKAEEIKSTINASLSIGTALQVTMRPLPGPETRIQCEVLYQVFAGGEIESVSETFSGLPDEGS